MTTSTDRFDHALYDSAKPIVCTIGAAELPGHLALLERMRATLESVERTPYGVVLTLPGTAGNVADLRRFAADEKRCCQFWGFEVTERPKARLRWDAPPELAGYMDRLVGYFEGRAPIGDLFSGF